MASNNHAIDAWDPHVSKARVTRIARAQPTRLLEQAKPGPVKIYIGDGKVQPLPAPDPRTADNMPLPPCLRT